MPSFTDPPNGGKGQIRPALRLIHPAPPDPPKKYRRAAPPFTEDEERRLRAALRHARVLFGGTYACLADAMRVSPAAAQQAAKGRTHVSGDIAVRLARALGTTVDALCRPPTTAGTCPHCGRSGAP